MTNATALGIDDSLLHLPEPQKSVVTSNRKGCVHISIPSDCEPLWRPVCHHTQKAKKPATAAREMASHSSQLLFRQPCIYVV